MNMTLSGIYKMLRNHYGDLHWWPAGSPFEVIVGAILTQNTAWSNVEKAIARFSGNLSPEFVADIGTHELAEIIRPAGYYNQKAGYLKAVTAWFRGYNYDVDVARREPPDKLRDELLAVKGVGQETADSIVLYALELPTFVVDAYTFRLCERFPLDAGRSYADVKNYFESNLPRDVEIYNNFHALIVINGKDCCKKRNPLCDACPLADACLKLPPTC